LATSDARGFGNPKYPLFAAQAFPETLTDMGTPVLTLSNSKDVKPEIILSAKKTVYSDLTSVKGEVRGKNIEKVFLNGIPLNRKRGHIIFFNHTVRLKKTGKNEIMIRAEDSLGNKAAKTIIITREIPEPLKLKYRSMFKISLFEMNTGKAEEGVLLQHLFLDRLSAGNRFRIIMQDELEKNHEGTEIQSEQNNNDPRF